MAINPDIRLKIKHFIKDNYKSVILVIVVFLIVILINRVLMKKRYSRKNSNYISAKCFCIR